MYKNRLTTVLDRRRTIHVFGTIALFLVVFLFVAAAVPQVVGADHSYVVLSDSMSPSIDAGAVVFVSEVSVDTIERDDVITYKQSGNADDRRVTHRVVEVVEHDGERQFRTKGDANEDPDPSLVRPSQVVGVVQFHVLYIGYVTSFAQTKLGLVALVIIPAILLMVSEMWDLATAGQVVADEESAETEGGNNP